MTSTRRRPARGVWRWFSVLLVGSAAALLVTPGGAVAAPMKTTLQLTSLTPLSPQGDDTLRAKGTFVSNRTLDDVVIRLEVGTTPFVSRTSITEAAANPPFTTAVPGAEDDLRKVRRGQREQFTVAVPAGSLPIAFAGVYPLRVVAVDGDTGAELSATDTFLPWAPEGVGVPESRLLMFWPMVSQPARDSTGSFVTSTLPASTAPGGRLTTLVRTGADAPVTWVVDPALLDAVSALDEPSAAAWIESFRAAAGQREVVALPFGDPDVAAVAAAGRPGFLRQGRQKGERVYQRIIGATARSDLSWPADGAADDRVIGTSGRAGDAFVLLAEENLPVSDTLSYTPSGRVAWEEPALDLLLADGPASALVASPADTTSDVLLARQRFLAETLLHALELPNDPRLLVIAPPRRWDPSAQWSDELVRAIRRAQWLKPVSLDAAVRPEAPTVERAAPSIPAISLERQLPESMVTSARRGLTDNSRLAERIEHCRDPDLNSMLDHGRHRRRRRAIPGHEPHDHRIRHTPNRRPCAPVDRHDIARRRIRPRRQRRRIVRRRHHLRITSRVDIRNTRHTDRRRLRELNTRRKPVELEIPRLRKKRAPGIRLRPLTRRRDLARDPRVLACVRDARVRFRFR
ncbi:MAG TPA: DUF6049 family protein [Actinomycetes bacterium]|nr:DUF6049 family protein [Actinomycetes bacterium]